MYMYVYHLRAACEEVEDAVEVEGRVEDEYPRRPRARTIMYLYYTYIYIYRYV